MSKSGAFIPPIPPGDNGVITINDIAPDGLGNFSLTSSDNSITITPITNGEDLKVTNPPPPFSATTHLVYVDSLSGNDTTGTGTAINPFATIAKANSSITTNSATNLYCIFATGLFSESSMAIKPWVSIQGSSIGSTAITVSGNVTLDTSWNNSTGAFASISDITFSASFSMTITGTGTSAKLTFNNCTMSNIGFSPARAAIVDTLIFKNSSTGIFQIQDANGEIYSSSMASVANASSTIATTARALRVVGSIVTGNVTVTSSSGQNMTATFSSTRIGGNASTTGLGAIVYDADSIPSGTLSGTTTASPIVNPAIGGTGVNNGTNTLTLGGNLTTSGAFNSTFTMTAATGVTFPTTGTLATTTQLPTPAALTAANDTNITLTLGGTPSTALLQASSITAGWAGQLAPARGGTGANNTATTGTILRGNGTNFVPTTATYPTTTTSQQMLYSTAANTVGELTTANSKLPATNSSGTLAMRAFSINIQTFAANGTYTPSTGMLYCTVEVQAPGGGGGGCATTGGTAFASASGGASGEYAMNVYSAATIGASQTVTVPAGGGGGAAGNNSGSSGTTCSFGALLTCGGGAGGVGGSAQTTGGSTNGGTGGSGGTGTAAIRFSGVGGGQGNNFITGNILQGGSGAQSRFSGGTDTTVNEAGANASGYGGGGSGASNGASSAARAGGNGSSGLVVVTEYIIN